MRNIMLLTVMVLLFPFWANSLYETWDLPGADDIMGITMISESDGWALERYSNLYHWDGEEWTYVRDLSGGNYIGMEYYDSTHIYVYQGSSIIFCFDGEDWELFDPLPPEGCWDLEVLGPDDIWTTGFKVSYKANTSILHWDGVEWEYWNEPPGFENDVVYCLGFGSADEGWAGGDNGAMSHFYDGEWHAVEPLLTDCNLVCSSFANPGYGMMGGEGVKMVYYESHWEAYEAPPYYINDIYAIDDEFIVFVTEGGGISLYHYDDYETGIGTGGIALYSVHATAPNDIWAGGEDGFVCHWSWGVGIQPSSVGRIKALFGGEGVSSAEAPGKSEHLR